MQGSGPIGEAFDVVGRLGSGVAPESGHWFVTMASCLAVLAIGGAAARLARRLTRRSTPELVVLLDQSAAFFGRWPEHRLAAAPPAELAAEASRCRRLIELLEALETGAPDGEPGRTGVIASLRTWIALLGNVIDAGADALSGPAYA